MAMEVLDQSQPWPIPLPEEPPRDRPLEARRSDGTVWHTFRYDGKSHWIADGKHSIGHGVLGFGMSWSGLVSSAMVDHLTLTSLPPETGDGA